MSSLSDMLGCHAASELRHALTGRTACNSGNNRHQHRHTLPSTVLVAASISTPQPGETQRTRTRTHACFKLCQAGSTYAVQLDAEQWECTACTYN